MTVTEYIMNARFVSQIPLFNKTCLLFDFFHFLPLFIHFLNFSSYFSLFPFLFPVFFNSELGIPDL